MVTEDIAPSARARSPARTSAQSPRRTLVRGYALSPSQSPSRSPPARNSARSPRRRGPSRRVPFKRSSHALRSVSPRRRPKMRDDDLSDSDSYSDSYSDSESRSRSPPRRGRPLRRKRRQSYSFSSDDDYSSYSSRSWSRSRSRSRGRSRGRSRSPRQRGRDGRYNGRSTSPRRGYGREGYRRGYASPKRYRGASPMMRRTRRAPKQVTRERMRREDTGKESRMRTEDERSRDIRTVFIWQLAQRVREADIFEFFSQAGRVRDVRLIKDRMSSRHKSAGYVEFYDVDSVDKAVAMDGRTVCGFPIAVKPTVDQGVGTRHRNDATRRTGVPVPIEHGQSGDRAATFDESLVGWSMGRRPVRQVGSEGPRENAMAGSMAASPVTGPTQMVSIEQLKILLNPLGLPVPKMSAAVAEVGQGVEGIAQVPLPTTVANGHSAGLSLGTQGGGFTRLYIGSISFQLTEAELRAIFSPFGPISSLQIQRDGGGRSRGYGFVEFVTHESAKKALEINGLAVAGRTLKVGLASLENRGVNGAHGASGTSGEGGAIVPLPGHAGESSGVGHGGADVAGELDEGKDGGLALNMNQRVMLMQQLSRGEMVAKGDEVRMAESKEASRTLMLSKMFNPLVEAEGFELDLAEDVRDECTGSYGKVVHLHVEKKSEGIVFIRFESLEAGMKAMKGLNGRWFGGMKIEAVYVKEEEYEKRFGQVDE